MHFRTEIQTVKQTNDQINYHSKILLMGSCFTNNIGLKLTNFKFNTLVNPFGILFHPKAIEKLINFSLNNRSFTEQDLIFQNERWHCLYVHSDFSSINKINVLTTLNKTLKKTKNYITTASHIVLTLGTSWVYRYRKTDNVVANCHKIPQNNFIKELLSVSEIYKSLISIITIIKKVNPNVKIILTLSPVRHLKDGFIENQLSKAHLTTAIQQVIDKSIHYFPAYEIMMDDLRDYRFYKKDKVHPNEIAIDYIWEKFIVTWIQLSENKTMKQVQQINRGLAHKPFNNNSKQHQEFLKTLQNKIELLEKTKGILFKSNLH